MKRNISNCFFRHRISHQPLYKVLVAFAVTVCVAVSMGGGIMAAAMYAGDSTPVEPASTAEPAPADAQPEATPAPTPVPDVELSMSVSVVQQDLGVEIDKMVPWVDDNIYENPEDEELVIPQQDSKAPLTGVPMTLVVTDEKGEATEYELDALTGTLLVEDLTPGEYTVSVQETEGYIVPASQQATVNEKVVYKADVEAVKDKIVQSSQVSEASEDASYGGSTTVAEELTNTVVYAESAKTETGSTTAYTPTLDGDYVKLKDGTTSPYKPVYENDVLVGFRRDSNLLAAVAGQGAISYLGKATGGSVLRLNAEPAPQAETEGEPTPEITEEPTVTATPEPTATPTAEPTATATATPEATATAAPTAEPTATATPTAAPTATPTATPNKYASWPEYIAVTDVDKYGFAVSGSSKPTYEYTGWQTIGGVTYYYNPENHTVVTGSQVINGVMYNFGNDGALQSNRRGIDVSKFQGSINWSAVKADGVDFAIIRVGYRGYGSGALVEDSTYKANIRGAIAAGIPVGVYFYSQAINEAEAVEEASMVLSLIGGYSLSYPVYFDTEKADGAGRADGLSASERTACAVAFCETIRNAGYSAGVYSYASWFYNGMNYANISKYRIWIAQYRDVLSFNYGYNMWQYSSKGKVAGINANVDMNISY